MSSTPPPEPSANEPASGGADWRASVPQAHRSAEVREIAKVLASLEPGASEGSKLSLAYRFEDAIFKQAESLADYRKKIAKRLKKTQKNYKPPAEVSTAPRPEQVLIELRQKYGDSLLYIIKHAKVAVDDIRTRHGDEKANQMEQHTDTALQWAKELGVYQEEGTIAKTGPNTSATSLSMEQVLKLQQLLEKRVENIRSYVVKHGDPDLFLLEKLEAEDAALKPRAKKLLGANLQKRWEQLQKKDSIDVVQVLQTSLDKAQVPVPHPTKQNANPVPAALLHLDKTRAASTALLAYLCTPDRAVAPRNSLATCNTVASQGMTFIKETAEIMKQQTGNVEVKLQDAWLKALEIQPPAASTDTATQDGNKRVKMDHVPPVIASRVLLTPKRKLPMNFMHALKRKRAKLVRHKEGVGAHLNLDFGKAFTMTIYLCPLVVTIRAMKTDIEEEHEALMKSTSISTATTSLVGCGTWTPLYTGLQNRSEPLEVWGVTGDYTSIGHVVEERLRDASMHATHILRQLFRNSVKDKTQPFEVEILESSALLEFLQIARKTFQPDWQDDDV